MAFSELYKKYVVKLTSIAVNKIFDRIEVEELVQNSFLKLYQHKDSISADTSIFAYLYVILKNQILNHYRKQLVHKAYENHILNHQLKHDDSLLEIIETRELEKKINSEIKNLPEKCRNVFILSRNENLSNKEISRALCISENTVEQHMRKALGRLRNSIQDYL